MKRLCSICARGGSKGLKNKNTKIVFGKPLIAYTILQARKSGLFDKVVVSSDSDDILECAKKYGVDLLVRRPNEMASDHASKIPSIIHCAREVEKNTGIFFDTFVDLDCTSPLRTIEDIQGAVHLLESTDASNVITGAESRRSPYFNLVEIKGDGSLNVAKELPAPIVRRQDAPVCYDMNASVYVWKRAALLNAEKLFNSKTKLYEMPDSRSMDIDTELDLEIVTHLISKRSDLLNLG